MNSTKQIYSWLVKHDELTFVACNELELMRQLETMGVEVWNINYDINYNTDDKVICKDAIFDDVEFHGCVVHWNCEKTYPIGRIHSGEFILRGDNQNHNGDCSPIKNCEQLISQNQLSEVYDMYQDGAHTYVYGRT
jgi:hypothetical protein|tara:strand:+ start:1143 stop:1550 length:408 start_codon:yes stop_codon:yes gene_type:complete